ncbi:methyl-accepting chemotaxis protein [Chitinimonas sp.]|uniref:methyl-accepting chemotaxis protein n=1 Tax=Chitinimonas sp. TaxID=1934313 RepID=UPI002F95338E
MTLRTKLILLVAGLLTLMLFMGISNLMKLASTNEHFASTYNDRVVPLKQLKVVSDMYAVNIVDTTHKLNHKALSWDAAKRNYAEAQANITQQWKAYLATELTDEEKQLVARADADMRKADSLVTQLNQLIGAQDSAGLDQLARQALYPTIDPLTGAISDLVELQLREARKSYEAAQLDYAHTRTVTMVSLLLGLLLGAGISSWLLIGMNNKIASLRNTLRTARDENDLTLRAPVRGDDEIDSIARAYNTLVDNMQGLVRTVAEAVDTVNQEATQLATTTEQVADASSMGSEATSSMAAAVEEVTVSIAHVADNAQEAHIRGEATLQQAQQGSQRILATVSHISEIDTAVSTAADKVTTLGNDATNITSIVAVIKDVADQTNLLALNAAIEAARAGEQGRGFAVVADEVRKLAERTAGATQDIQQMVTQISHNSLEAVGAMSQTVARAHECAELASGAGDSISAISESIALGEEAIASIAEALHEHKAGTQQIAQQVERVAQLSEENNAAVATMSRTAATLGGLTERLQGEVHRFRYH